MGLAGESNEGPGIGEAAADRLELGLRQRARARVRVKFGTDRLVWPQRQIEIGKGWRIEQPKAWLRRLDQSNVDRKLAPALNKPLGAVEGIDEKEAIGRRREIAGRTRFFGDDGHARGQAL